MVNSVEHLSELSNERLVTIRLHSPIHAICIISVYFPVAHRFKKSLDFADLILGQLCFDFFLVI